MSERFTVVCIPCKALYKCSALIFLCHCILARYTPHLNVGAKHYRASPKFIVNLWVTPYVCEDYTKCTHTVSQSMK